jgi:hypothetical protein
MKNDPQVLIEDTSSIATMTDDEYVQFLDDERIARNF